MNSCLFTLLLAVSTHALAQIPTTGNPTSSDSDAQVPTQQTWTPGVVDLTNTAYSFGTLQTSFDISATDFSSSLSLAGLSTQSFFTQSSSPLAVAAALTPLSMAASSISSDIISYNLQSALSAQVVAQQSTVEINDRSLEIANLLYLANGATLFHSTTPTGSAQSYAANPTQYLAQLASDEIFADFNGDIFLQDGQSLGSANAIQLAQATSALSGTTTDFCPQPLGICSLFMAARAARETQRRLTPAQNQQLNLEIYGVTNVPAGSSNLNANSVADAMTVSWVKWALQIGLIAGDSIAKNVQDRLNALFAPAPTPQNPLITTPNNGTAGATLTGTPNGGNVATPTVTATPNRGPQGPTLTTTPVGSNVNTQTPGYCAGCESSASRPTIIMNENNAANDDRFDNYGRRTVTIEDPQTKLTIKINYDTPRPGSLGPVEAFGRTFQPDYQQSIDLEVLGKPLQTGGAPVSFGAATYDPSSQQFFVALYAVSGSWYPNRTSYVQATASALQGLMNGHSYSYDTLVSQWNSTQPRFDQISVFRIDFDDPIGANNSLTEYWANLARGMRPVDAARNTVIGEAASQLGFNRVEIISTQVELDENASSLPQYRGKSGITVKFTRPIPPPKSPPPGPR